MTDDPLSALVAGTFGDPRGGPPLDVGVRSVVIDDLGGREAELVSTLELGGYIAVVSDADTHGILGSRVERALASVARIQRIVLERRPRADEATAARLAAQLPEGVEAVVAVGSGTINDLCKITAHRRGHDYVVFGTAPSMNGYTSMNASISGGGAKRSLPARAPVGAFFDLATIAAAPPRMLRAGLGECACRPTAQTDWLLSHLLLGTPYRELPFAILAADEAALFAEPEALLAGDRTVIRHLMRSLILSGFGMTISGGSYPASQGEHLISHYFDIRRRDDDPAPLHGEQMAVTTVYMARLQERMLRSGQAPVLQSSPLSQADVIGHFGPQVGQHCWEELQRKELSEPQLGLVNERLAARWSSMRAQLLSVARPAAELATILQAAGAATDPAALGWTGEQFAQACNRARQLRDRFTFLDFAALARGSR